MAELIGLDTKIIGVTHYHDILECIHEVMEEWMSAGPNMTTYPCTWKGLAELLDDVGLNKASGDLREAYSSGSSSTSKCFMNTQFSGSTS